MEKSKEVAKRSLLKEAISDIDQELKRLGKEKDSIKGQISGIDKSVENAQASEKAFQEKIAKLLEKEARLTEKKKSNQVMMDRLADKLGKIEKIKSEMADV